MNSTYYVVRRAAAARNDIRNSSYGILAEGAIPTPLCTTGAALTTQTLYGFLVGLRAGDVVNGFAVNITTAAAGTVPTSFLAVIQDSTGKALFTSEEKNNAAWVGTPGMQKVTFSASASYTIQTSGGYFCSLWENGAFGTTPLQLGTGGTSAAANQGIASGPPWGTGASTASVVVGSTYALTVPAALRLILPCGIGA